MVSTLFQNDMKYLRKDPTMWVLAGIPILFVVLYQCVVLRIAFLNPFLAPIQYVCIIMSSCMSGVLWGLRMLDDKDEQMLAFYAVSPLGMKGYLHYKVDICLIYSFIATSIVVWGVGGEVSPKIGMLINAVCLGPLVNLIIFGLAKNKLQGMVYAKAMGILVMLPLTGLIRENIFTPVIKLLPQYAIYEQLCIGEMSGGSYIVYIGGTLVMVYLLYSYQLRRR
ncbi:MAG: hypothetical protein ACRDDX_15200 [Cellulosilyticaceae bacterium]